MKFIDLTGEVFGRLTVLHFLGRSGSTYYWMCKCNCVEQTEKAISRSCLTSGHTKSCGCLRREMVISNNIIHDMSKSREFRMWAGMIGRCNNTSNPEYHNYGGRGIKVCEGWKSSFENWYADMGPAPSRNHSQDRIDNDCNYSCGHCDECIMNEWLKNCRWATPTEQSNNKRTNRILDFDGRSQTIAQWSRELNLTYGTIISRLSTGWTIEKTLSTPIFTEKKLTFNDKTMTINEWSKELGINSQRIRERLRDGWSIERTLSEPCVKVELNRLFEIDGRTLTIPEWSKESGVRKSIIYYRMSKGLSIKEAITKPVQKFTHNSRA